MLSGIKVRHYFNEWFILQAMLESKIKNQFVNAAFVNSYSIKSLIGLTQENVKDYLSDEFDKILGYNENYDMKISRLDKFKVKNAVLDDYNQKIIDIDNNGKKVLAGIRHVGGNVEKPFILYGQIISYIIKMTLKLLLIELNHISKYLSPPT